ncbi:sigma-E factor negative regulatory protein [Herbaspirillum lusitanum]|uniref:Sigma-E factor negative regulatory protein n=1 Tax=Herbaspirillum lusitanum TaxID=213312 RepID=A0ABW9A6R4_9BURK
MDTKVTTNEQISALADGELSAEQMTIALASLRSPEERERWDVYHQIGDVMRSDDMGFSMSAGFSAKMSAMLDAEPTIVAPQTPAAEAPVSVPQKSVANGVQAANVKRGNKTVRRFMMPGAAVAAAVAAVVFVTMPQQAVVSADSGAAPQIASSAPMAAPAAVTTVAASSTPANMSMAPNVPTLSALAQQGEVKRDPRIDDYLFAHQRFSPSMYSSAQYARSAAFSVDADK